MISHRRYETLIDNLYPSSATLPVFSCIFWKKTKQNKTVLKKGFDYARCTT